MRLSDSLVHALELAPTLEVFAGSLMRRDGSSETLGRKHLMLLGTLGFDSRGKLLQRSALGRSRACTETAGEQQNEAEGRS